MRTRNILLGLALILGVAFSEGSPAVWEKSVTGGLNLTQTGFDNWIAGGESALAWQMNFNFKFIKDLAKTSWSTSGKMAYGATKIGDQEMKKSIDEIKIESVLTYKLGSTINPFSAITGQTQLSGAYDYGQEEAPQISAFMDPGYFRESFGVGFDAHKGVSTRLGLALKQTTTKKYPAPYSDDVETVALEFFKNEAGLESVTDISWIISESACYESKMEMFSTFKAFDETDINWDNTLTVKISKYINMNMNVMLIYDKDLSKKRQIKQAMAFGLNYTFI